MARVCNCRDEDKDYIVISDDGERAVKSIIESKVERFERRTNPRNSHCGDFRPQIIDTLAIDVAYSITVEVKKAITNDRGFQNMASEVERHIAMR
jgi:hypothetical protein